MPSETVENYLKAVYTLSSESPGAEATVTKVAALVGVTAGTATAMLQKLAAGKLLRYQRYGAAKLTAKGEKAALDVLRRHRIVEQFLVQVVGLDWSEVHEEAERLEHAVSPRLLERLDALLGRPRSDPHGDPIPDAQGKVAVRPHTPLSAAAPGARVTIARVLDQSPDFLRFLETHALRPGRIVSVESSDAAAQAMTLRNDKGKAVTLATAAAAKIAVEPAGRA